jgi:protocatechuate 3,4-dioxygenase beta subunit
MTLTMHRPSTLRKRLLRRFLTAVTSRIDNREAIRRAVTFTPHEATRNHGKGPYYVPGSPIRRDVREDRQGSPLVLRIRSVDVDTLAPIAGATVEIWQADADGFYSGFTSNDPERFPPVVSLALRRFRPVDDTRFLRGRQITDDDGWVEFLTIAPGWYTPQTLHIHAGVSIAGKAVLMTELFFSDEFTAEIQSLPEYAHRGASPFTNTHDVTLRLTNASPGGWPTVRPIESGGHRADVTLQVRR